MLLKGAPYRDSHFSLLEKSESDFHFTFHFSNFQYPLLQDTVVVVAVVVVVVVVVVVENCKSALELMPSIQARFSIRYSILSVTQALISDNIIPSWL